ncbi:U-box domain-containing protein 16 [Triticum urartu]|uniref:RING-type E3 ubiquitin transferase n=1 Tax=Triticum urartu TaxID=4572 RepID=M7Z9Q4_TRIUA|nr:U-box domain-containing protein 16 [Triticum urartu]
MRRLLQSDDVAARVRELQHDLATLLDILPVGELGLADDVADLLTLASRQCRRPAPEAAAEQELKASVLALIQECVLFSAATPRPLDSKVDADDDDAEPLAPPPDFRCPISLDLMRDPVVSSSGQTYDRESITRWFGAGKSTCPKTGQNGVAMEGSEPGKPEPAPPVAANKAAVEAARMTASFLVKKLSASFSPGSDNRVVHEIRLLAKSGSESRAFIGEAGAVPLLVPLLNSEDAALQLNAVTALLNLSILDANKKRIMHTDGAVAALCELASACVLSTGTASAIRPLSGRW